MTKIPLWLKLVYTAFVCVLVLVRRVVYTPWNFLYFCDVALILTLAGLWLESPFLISMQALGIVLMQMLWVFDFTARAVIGTHITGMTAYMFNDAIPLFVRGLSLFHGWLPFLLLWLLMRLGYDRRAIWRNQRWRSWCCSFVISSPPRRLHWPAGPMQRSTSITCMALTTSTRKRGWRRSCGSAC